jgi:hypothetical protein
MLYGTVKNINTKTQRSPRTQRILIHSLFISL